MKFQKKRAFSAILLKILAEIISVGYLKLERLSPEKLRQKVKGISWIFPYNEILAVFDARNKLIELVEDYAPANGLFAEAWRTLHFPRTSRLVVSARREGTKSIFRIKPGKAELNLTPTFSPIGIQQAEAFKDLIKITYAGLGGGGVSASYCRGLAKGVEGVEVIRKGGGNKLGIGAILLPRLEKTIISVDDTDNEEEGATYALVHNIAQKLNSKKIRYFTHVNSQLFPENPNKTKNCMSTAVSFIHKPGLDSEINAFFKKQLKKHTLSNNTAFVSYNGILLPAEVQEYARMAKSSFLSSIAEAQGICERNNVKHFTVTGDKGLIGALAGLGMHDNPEFAASLPNIYEL